MAFPVLRIGLRSWRSLEKNIAGAFTILNNPEYNNNNVGNIRFSSLPFAHPSLRNYSKHTKQYKSEKNKHKSDSEFDSTSSSDHEPLGHRGESDFWRRKMRTFHGILDVNKDGVISYDDFKLLADRFVNLGHLGEKKSAEFHNVLKDLWIKRWGEITPYNLVTVERYLEDMHHILNDKPLKKKMHAFLPFLFKAIDKDKSGTINLDDFKLFFECLGLSEVDAVFSFRTIDTNADGRLTLKEFVSHGKQFFLTEDQECISKYFFGPLMHH